MKKILFLGLLLAGLLMAYGCVPPEEAENQAATALEQLSDDELQQLEEQTTKVGEGMAIAGQGYRISPSASSKVRTAAAALQRVNRQQREALIYQERTNRAGTQDFPCNANSDCAQNLLCLPDSVTRRNTCQGPPWPLGAPCGGDQYCASSICGRNQENQIVCEPPGQPFRNVCSKDAECASNVCDILRRICLLPTGSSCENSLDCASVLCTIPPEGSGRENRQSICKDQYATPNGGDCVLNNECRSRLCGRTDTNNGVCEEYGSNDRGDACVSGQECRSERCIITETTTASGVVPFADFDDTVLIAYVGECS